MVALAAAADAAKIKVEAPRRRWRMRLLTLAGLAAAAAAGFFIVARLAPDPNAQLLQELPLLENVDEYREIGNIDFLHALMREGLFTKNADGSAAAGRPSGVERLASETIAKRRQQVEAMTADQRDDLFRNEQEFRALPAEEQQHIRELHAAIESATDGTALLAVMHRYSKWLEDQPVWERGQLHRMKQPQRVAEIKMQLTRHKRPDNEIPLDSKSRQALVRWLEHFVSERGIGLLPHNDEGGPGGPPPGLAKLPPQDQHRLLRAMAYHGWKMGDPAFRLQLSDDERASLRACLTPEIRSQLAARPQPEQAEIVAGWLRETASTQFDERLAEFFESTLNDKQRDAIMSLPGDEMYARPREAYMQHLSKQMKPGEPPHQPHGDREHRGPHHGGPPGPGGHRWMDHPAPPPDNDSKPAKNSSSAPAPADKPAAK